MNLDDLLETLDCEEKQGHWLLARLSEYLPDIPIDLVGVLDENGAWVSLYSAAGAKRHLPGQVKEYLKSARICDTGLVSAISAAGSTLFAVPVECRCFQASHHVPRTIRGVALAVLGLDASAVADLAGRLRSPLQAVGCSALLAGMVERYSVWVAQLQNERASLQQSQMEAVAQALEEHEKVLLAEESHRALRELMEARDAAQRAKDLFFANLSHELRTPLHGILSYAAFGIKKGETAERATLLKYFTQIERSGRTLLAFLNDLLDLAKLEAGKMQYDFAWHNPAQSMIRVLDELNSASEQRCIHFDFSPPPETLTVWMDDKRIQQVFRNLIGNAIKFSPEGGEIQIAMAAKDGCVLVTVADHGCGIPTSELESIFDPFVQSSKTRTASGGTGLGLAICREIVRSHKGEIWAENRPEGGACFWVRLPIHPAKVYQSPQENGIAAVAMPAASEMPGGENRGHSEAVLRQG
ncbi:MAG: sensor histidine kinase [Thermogutta sp.]